MHGIEPSMNPRRLHDRKTEHFKVITSGNHSSAIADHGHHANNPVPLFQGYLLTPCVSYRFILFDTVVCFIQYTFLFSLNIPYTQKVCFLLLVLYLSKNIFR